MRKHWQVLAQGGGSPVRLQTQTDFSLLKSNHHIFSSMYCDIFTKPLGLIRIFLAVLGILSLVSLLDFGGSFEFALHCPAGQEIISIYKTVKWNYPFRLTSVTVPLLSCNGTTGLPTSWEKAFYIDFHSQAKFFAFIAAMSSLLSSVWLMIYLLCWVQYDIESMLSFNDTALSVVAGLLWLCANSAWASALISMKGVTSTEQIQRILLGVPACQSGNICEITDKKEEFGRGVFALVIGFGNCFLWFTVALLAFRERRRVVMERRG